MSLAVSHRPTRLSRKSRTAKLRKTADRILRLNGLEKSDLSVVLCDNAFIQDLNRQWRKKDAPTDVLSFAAATPDEIQRHRKNPDAFPLVLGDVVISLDIVHERVGDEPAAEMQEITRLLVHGIVHLMGYDHEEDTQAQRMERLERDILSAMGQPDA